MWRRKISLLGMVFYSNWYPFLVSQLLSIPFTLGINRSNVAISLKHRTQSYCFTVFRAS